MKKTNIERLSELHAQIWFLDDVRSYDTLQKRVEELIELRGGNPNIAKYISASYKTYGLLQDKKIDTDSELVFKKIFNNFLRAHTLFGVRHPWMQAYFNTLWWKEFFYKDQVTAWRYLKIILAIFLLHLAKLGIPRMRTVLSCSKYCILAGSKGHNTKSIKICQKYLVEYWRNVPQDTKFICF